MNPRFVSFLFENEVCSVGDDFIHVHVGLGTASGLPDDEREVLIPLSVDHFVGRLHNRYRLGGIKVVQTLVGQGRTLF